jgi:hypothetical protein
VQYALPWCSNCLSNECGRPSSATPRLQNQVSQPNENHTCVFSDYELEAACTVKPLERRNGVRVRTPYGAASLSEVWTARCTRPAQQVSCGVLASGCSSRCWPHECAKRLERLVKSRIHDARVRTCLTLSTTVRTVCAARPSTPDLWPRYALASVRVCWISSRQRRIPLHTAYRGLSF